LGVPAGPRPTESTIRRVFARLDADLLDQVIGAFLWTRTRVGDGRRIIAIDGKTVRGARTAHAVAPHLVAAFDHAAGAVLGQLAVAAKSNEIPAVRDLLATFELKTVAVTVDAMHTQTDTATAITAAGGDYVFTVKKNQPSLHAACKDLPWQDVPAHRVTSTGHGRRVTRTIKVVAAPAWVGFAGATQLAQVRRTVTRAGKNSVEVVYLITSADHAAAPPATLAGWIQGHWSIENRLCATRRLIAFPAEPGGIGGLFLGPMTYLDPKGEGNKRMSANQRPCPGVWGGALGDPRDMAKAGLLESQSPVMKISHPPERRLKPAPAPCTGMYARAGAAFGCWTMPSEGIQGDEWDAYVTLQRAMRTNVGSPTGREPQGDGGLVVVVRVTPHQGGRESRPQGEGGQVIGHQQVGRYA